ncbi:MULTISPECIES: sugar-binding transcriptional regulator [unclassified Agrobacterium]|uniref:sugar-binding transcriptional regulator n=1 Tax=unclassified Agrobacterium TaxID=2632611 RepID=UPI00083D3E16|nr:MULTISPECIES: sugar-binding transcriptional regulator [unclassified Agrobacterium]AOG09355.1 putative sugar-binding domain protein [Agrobacterium sp. RAC06]
MVDNRDEFDQQRQMYSVLVLHFIEGVKQSEIAEKLNLSHTKVNRMIAAGRKAGMVKISISSPYQRLVDMENDVTQRFGLKQSVVTPTVSDNPETTLQMVGRVAANHLLETLRDGDVIAITGGKAVSAVVENLEAERRFDVRVVPLTGGVQGKHYTDVNHLATQLADKLGGTAQLVHAPLFAEDDKQRDLLMNVASIREVFDLARQATVALVGIGSVQAPGSGYYDLLPDPARGGQALVDAGIAGEFLAHLIKADGSLAEIDLNSRVVALDPADLANCPTIIGVAAGSLKAGPVAATLAGRFLTSLVVDEEIARALDTHGEG